MSSYITIANQLINDYKNENQLTSVSLLVGSINDEMAVLSYILNFINKNPILNKNNYKMEYFYDLLSFVTNEVIKINDYDLTETLKKYFEYLLDHLLLKTSCLSKGQHLLQRLNKLIETNKISPEIYLIESSSNGSFMTFMYWLALTEKDITLLPNNILEEIVINSIGNSDDRLFKYILEKILSVNKLFLQIKNNIIENMIDTLNDSPIPIKYILKRIKLLSECVNLNPYFNRMIETFSSEKIIFQLYKYYYKKPQTFKDIFGVVKKIDNYDYYNSILKTEDEKTILTVCVSVVFNIELNNNINMNKLDNIVKNNSILIIKWMKWNNITQSNKLNNMILKILVNYNLITSYIEEEINDFITSNMLHYTRFIKTPNNIKPNSELYNIININKSLHILRLAAKRKKRTTIVQNQSKIYRLLNDIKTFTPNNKCTVLSRGSLSYQLNKHKFNRIPPRHLLPGEILNYNNYLLKDKVDGILINNSPTNIFPVCDLFNTYQIKAEYVEDLDLYLVFDIDIPNTSIEDRYQILRNHHTYTNDNNNIVINIKEFVDKLLLERKNINKFIKENTKHLIKWYPKFACKVVDSNEINKEIINNIIINDTDIMKTICYSDIYNCDGIIITPLDGSREIKIKPKKLMTIDLLYDGINWLDRDNNKYNNIIQGKFKATAIYRCYPNPSNNLFTPKEIRFEKKHPNPYNVINNIMSILEYNWEQEMVQSNYYYEKKNYNKLSKRLSIMLRNQYELLEKHINNMNPEINKNWLDLGCGSGKLINIIKKYSPKSYLGLDIDIKQLVKGLKYHDENQNYNFNPCDIKENWNNSKMKWLKLNDMKYDYIVANFSLMHFISDLFWEQLNIHTKSGTKFMFNLVANNMIKWNESNSYIYVEDKETKYMFEWVHNNMKTEPFIEEKVVVNYLNQHNWNILNKVQYNGKDLTGQYTWWLIEKN
jgi:SAM-dependent methyltransferase